MKPTTFVYHHRTGIPQGPVDPQDPKWVDWVRGLNKAWTDACGREIGRPALSELLRNAGVKAKSDTFGELLRVAKGLPAKPSSRHMMGEQLPVEADDSPADADTAPEVRCWAIWGHATTMPQGSADDAVAHLACVMPMRVVFAYGARVTDHALVFLDRDGTPIEGMSHSSYSSFRELADQDRHALEDNGRPDVIRPRP